MKNAASRFLRTGKAVVAKWGAKAELLTYSAGGQPLPWGKQPALFGGAQHNDPETNQLRPANYLA